MRTARSCPSSSASSEFSVGPVASVGAASWVRLCVESVASIGGCFLSAPVCRVPSLLPTRLPNRLPRRMEQRLWQHEFFRDCMAGKESQLKARQGDAWQLGRAGQGPTSVGM